MNYFETLPQISVSDFNGNNIIATNLLVRAELIPALAKNPVLFYQYDIQDRDTPEIIADKYYGDPYRYWIVLFGNQILDPQWNWPMNQNLFADYLFDKYASATANSLSIPVSSVTPGQVLAYTQSNIQEYVKVIQTTDAFTSNTTTIQVPVTSSAYANVFPSTITNTFPDGNQVTQVITKNTVSLYDYEQNMNESNRTIYLINSAYVSQFESQLKTLMGV